jgi:hypothetical protein
MSTAIRKTVYVVPAPGPGNGMLESLYQGPRTKMTHAAVAADAEPPSPACIASPLGVGQCPGAVAHGINGIRAVSY